MNIDRWKLPWFARLHCSLSLATFNFNWINLKIDVYFTYLLHMQHYAFCTFCFAFFTNTHTYRESQAIFIKISLNKRIFEEKQINQTEQRFSPSYTTLCNTYVSHVISGFLSLFMLCVWVTISNKMFIFSNCKYFR